MRDRRIGELRRLKAQRNLGYEELAAGIGVSFMSVYRWIKKGVLPRNRLVIRAIDGFLARNGGPRKLKSRSLQRRETKPLKTRQLLTV